MNLTVQEIIYGAGVLEPWDAHFQPAPIQKLGLGHTYLQVVMPQTALMQFNYVPETELSHILSTLEALVKQADSLKKQAAEAEKSLVTQRHLLDEILERVSTSTVPEIELEEISDHEARERILALFNESKESLYYDVIAERLKLPLRQTVEVCNQLEAEGLIGERQPSEH